MSNKRGMENTRHTVTTSCWKRTTMSHNNDNRQSYHVRNTPRRQATGGILVAIVVDHNKRVLHNKLSAAEEEARQEVLASS